MIKLLIALALLLALIALLTKDKWGDMPWGKEKYQEPSLAERSVR